MEAGQLSPQHTQPKLSAAKTELSKKFNFIFISTKCHSLQLTARPHGTPKTGIYLKVLRDKGGGVAGAGAGAPATTFSHHYNLHA